MNRIREAIRRLERRIGWRLPEQFRRQRIRHVDWLGWRFVLATLERDMFKVRVYQQDEIDLIKKVLVDGFEDKYPSEESIFVTLSILQWYVIHFPYNEPGDLLTLPDPMGAVEESQDNDDLEREQYLVLLNQHSQASSI